MAVTDYRFAGTADNLDDGKNEWNNPNNAKADDTSYADVLGAKNETSDYLLLTNFGFTSTHIPDGATIDGFEIVCSRYADVADQYYDSVFRLYYDSALIGDNIASATKWPITSPADATYGGATNKCGTTLTQANVLSTGFGIALKIAKGSNSNYNAAYVNYIKIRVYYTESGGGGIVVPVFLYHYMNHC